MLGLQICLAPNRISAKRPSRGGCSIASSAACVGHSSSGAGISEHGLSIRFGSEDLRAMALSLFIQHARDGGVR